MRPLRPHRQNVPISGRDGRDDDLDVARGFATDGDKTAERATKAIAAPAAESIHRQ
jgi:hypothetical protein